MSRSAQVAPAPHRFTREEYHRMGTAGLFANERVELLDGTIVTMSPQSSVHVATVHRLYRRLTRVLADTMCVRMQAPVVLDDWSEPEPDIAICRSDTHDYAHAHPRAPQVAVLCEVALSSLGYDRSEKATTYAASNIPEYWIVDVEGRRIEILSDPDVGTQRYRAERCVGEGEMLSVPGGATVTVAEILPPL